MTLQAPRRRGIHCTRSERARAGNVERQEDRAEAERDPNTTEYGTICDLSMRPRSPIAARTQNRRLSTAKYSPTIRSPMSHTRVARTLATTAASHDRIAIQSQPRVGSRRVDSASPATRPPRRAERPCRRRRCRPDSVTLVRAAAARARGAHRSSSRRRQRRPRRSFRAAIDRRRLRREQCSRSPAKRVPRSETTAVRRSSGATS